MLFVPLMIVAATSYFISRYFEPYSIYTKNLMAKGFLDKDNKDRNILDQLSLREMLETDYYTVHADAPFSSLVQAFKKSKRNVFPVINDAGEFLGVVFLEDIKERCSALNSGKQEYCPGDARQHCHSRIM